MWKGVVIKESMKKNILKPKNIVKARKMYLESEKEKGIFHFLYIKIMNSEKENFVRNAKSSLKKSWYVHICNHDEMIVIFREKVFKINDKKSAKKAREYGLSIGIKKELMSFEKLLKNPWG